MIYNKDDMAEKPNGESIVLREQIIEDEVTNLTLMIERTPSGEGRIRILGDLPFGNRDFAFDSEGRLVGTGTGVHNCRRPSWVRAVR
jgi:hypothetical protein